VTLRSPDFDVEGRSWPYREASHFVVVAGVRVHAWVIDRAPAAAARPTIVLLHGTGAGVHSFRDLVPLLAERFTIVAIDLPGHGFSGLASSTASFSASPTGTAAVIAATLGALGVEPDVVVGHSAGAAVAVCLVLSEPGPHKVRLLVGLGAALVPLEGAAAVLLPLIARWCARTPIASRVIAWRARQPGSVERLVRSTGSRLDVAGIDLYRKLAGCPGHVAGVLAMLAEWNLESVFDRLSLVEVPTLMVAAAGDRAVPVADQRRASDRVEHARLVVVDGGHLAHEEHPAEIARLIHEAANAAGVARATTGHA